MWPLPQHSKWASSFTPVSKVLCNRMSTTRLASAPPLINKPWAPRKAELLNRLPKTRHFYSCSSWLHHQQRLVCRHVSANSLQRLPVQCSSATGSRGLWNHSHTSPSPALRTEACGTAHTSPPPRTEACGTAHTSPLRALRTDRAICIHFLSSSKLQRAMITEKNFPPKHLA